MSGSLALAHREHNCRQRLWGIAAPTALSAGPPAAAEWLRAISGGFTAARGVVYPQPTDNSIRIAAEALRVIGLDTDLAPRHLSLSGSIGF
ncbi:MAG: hypothetical protein OEU26_16590 [Candidatus Tectomicrobia bacterium]|nr:hypothetical protein [Candidatus Tectomicrobia bacterium]